MKPAAPILRLLLGLVIAVLISSCSKPELLTDKYVTVKKTPLYKNVMLSGYYDDQLPKGDTLYAKDLFENCISIKIDGKKRYIDISDLKRIEQAKEELIVSETSPLPPLAQQFLYKYVNYWKWPFWVIAIGLVFVLFLLFSMGIGFELSFSNDMNLAEPGIELFPIWTFIAGLITGVWYFFYPETTQRVIYFGEFLEIWPSSNTAWLILIIAVGIALLNLRLLFRNLWRYKGYGIAVYGIYTLFGVLSLVFAIYTAIASIVGLILATAIFFGLNVLSGLGEAVEDMGKPSVITEESLRREREKREKEHKEYIEEKERREERMNRFNEENRGKW